MAIARQAAPIKFGVLTDMVIPKTPERDVWDDMVLPFELVFRDGFEQGVIDRPVELVRREVEGLPRGTVKAVIDVYGELVDEGCLACSARTSRRTRSPLREEIERAVPRAGHQPLRRRRLARRVDVRASATAP